MHSERACAEGHINDLDDSFRHFRYVGVRRLGQLKALHDLLRKTGGRSGLILFQAHFVLRRSRVREVIRAGSECTWNDDRGLDVPSRQFARTADGETIHAGLGGKIWSQVWRRSSAGATAADPNHQAFALLPQNRQGGSVYTLCAQYIHVVELRKLLGRKRFGRTEDHVTSVVDHDIESPV